MIPRTFASAFLLICFLTGLAKAQSSPKPCPTPANPLVIRGPTPAPICIPIRRGTLRSLVVPARFAFKVVDHPDFQNQPEPEQLRLNVFASEEAEIGSLVEYKLQSPHCTTTVRFQVAEKGIESDIEIQYESLERVEIRQLKDEITQGRETFTELKIQNETRIYQLEVELDDKQDELDESKNQQAEDQARIRLLKRQIGSRNDEIQAVQDKLKDTKAAAAAESQRHAEDAKRQAAESDRKTNDAIDTTKRKTWAEAQDHCTEHEAHRVQQENKGRKSTRFHAILTQKTRRKPGEEPLPLGAAWWHSATKVFLAPFTIPAQPHDPKSYDITAVIIHRKNQPPYEARLYDVSKSSKNPDVQAVLVTGETLTGVIAIPAAIADPIQTKPHRIEFRTNTQRSYVAHLRGWTAELVEVVVHPVTGAEAWAKELRENEQIIIAPRVVAGAFWIPNGLAGDARRLEPTWFAGGGLRITKGVSELLAFEGELIAGTTGEASFQEDTRSGTFARLHAGAALRFGHDTAPTLRFGVGVLGGFYDMTPESGQSSEYTGLLAFGFGYAKRYSEQWVLSASAAAVLQGAEELRTFEVGLQIGYGVTPGYTPK